MKQRGIFRKLPLLEYTTLTPHKESERIFVGSIDFAHYIPPHETARNFSQVAFAGMSTANEPYEYTVNAERNEAKANCGK